MRRLTKLTKPQSKMVTKYYKMAFWFVNRNPQVVCKDGKRDTYQDALLLICESAKQHDPSKAKFSTFIHWKYSRQLKRIKSIRDRIIPTMKNDDLAHMVDSGCMEAIRHESTRLDYERETEAERDEMRDMVQRSIKKLHPRDRQVLCLRFGIQPEGIGCGPTYTLEEVGRIFKISKERVRGIQKRAMSVMRDELAKRHPDLFSEPS